MELNREPPICLFNSFWLLQKSIVETYISICNLFQALQCAVNKYLFLKKFIWHP